MEENLKITHTHAHRSPTGGAVEKNLPGNAGDTAHVGSTLGQEDALEEEMAPAPVFLPGTPRGQRSLVGYSPWGCTRVRQDLVSNDNRNQNRRELAQDRNSYMDQDRKPETNPLYGQPTHNRVARTYTGEKTMPLISSAVKTGLPLAKKKNRTFSNTTQKTKIV